MGRQDCVAVLQPWMVCDKDSARRASRWRGLAGVDWLDADDAYRELAARAERDAEGKWWIASAGRQDAVEQEARLRPEPRFGERP